MGIEAVARRSGGWWAIEVPEYPGVFSQARRIDQVAGMAADALTAWLDREVSPDEISVTPHAEGELEDLFAQALDARSAAEESRAKAQRATRQAVAAAIRAGWALRDVGSFLGVSHQRIGAIAREFEGAIADDAVDALRESITSATHADRPLRAATKKS